MLIQNTASQNKRKCQKHLLMYLTVKWIKEYFLGPRGRAALDAKARENA